MKNILVFMMLFFLLSCATRAPNLTDNRDDRQVKQEAFVRHEGVKQTLYYPTGFYSGGAGQAQDRTARAWWNQ